MAAEAPPVPAPVRPSALEEGANVEPAPPVGEKTGKKGLDYYLGTREGRSRLLFVLWIVSVTVMGVGYALILWIWLRGGI